MRYIQRLLLFLAFLWFTAPVHAVDISCSDADINTDGIVDLRDYSLLVANFFSTNPDPARADINTDGIVDLRDYSVLVSQFFQECPTPTPTPGGSSVYRAFRDDSYWNTPIPEDAPIDPKNDIYIQDALDSSVSDPPYVRLSGAPDHGTSTILAWAYPIYWAQDGDPTYTISPSQYGSDIQARIPYGATPQTGSDGGIIVYDLGQNQVIELWQATYNSSSDTWSASSTKRWILDSNGLHKNVAGSDSSLNFGHRGVATPTRAIRLDEVASGSINRRLECFWHATGRPDDVTPWYYWPMAGYEQGKGGIIPEGLVLRIKPEIVLEDRDLSPAARIIAQALQEYGCMIGDNDGGTSNSLKLERNEDGWRNLDPDLSVHGLSSITFSDFEFILGGYDPRQ